MPETTCVVPNCSNKGDHIIPKDKTRRKAWIHAIRRGNSTFGKWEPPSKFSYLCKQHFTDDDYNSVTFFGTERERATLKKSAVPSRFTWSVAKKIPEIRARADRCEQREVKRRRLFTDLTNREAEGITSFTATIDSFDMQEEVVEETLETGGTDEFDQVNEETTYISTEMQTIFKPAFDIDTFIKDDKGIHFYTGLENYTKFLFVLASLGPSAFCLQYVYHQVLNISVPNQFLLVLIKLRRHSTNYELSRMFSIAESVVANVFATWIIFMYKQWSELNMWPSQDLVRYFAPSGFKRHFPKTRVIIDGTECPIKKPKNPISQQSTFSTYKNRNTMKVLVGATPGGLISYVSPAYGGSTSDRQIVERSALVNMCDPKDSIMADKGFNVQDMFAPYDVQVNMPTFFKKKNRMSGATVMRDRKISSKRVHIERLIGLAKTNKILTEPMSATETKFATEIIFCCFTLCNFRSSIMSKYS